MVPSGGDQQFSTFSFPRASGDGPWVSGYGAVNYTFPPRERGWSLMTRLAGFELIVSPARAGMVP